MLFVVQFSLLVVIIKHASGTTCLSNESKEDFDKSRKALTDVQENIGKVTKKLEADNKKILGIFKDTLNTMGQKIKKLDTDLKVIGTKFENDNKKTLDIFKGTLNTMGQKIKKLDTDFKVLGEDFRKTKWHKYNGHCYYYSSEKADWFTAERKCREIGGYIVKIDDKNENNNIEANRANKSFYYWIGLIDLKEGEWRWTYDQLKAGFTAWHPGYGSKGTASNCVLLHGSRTDWYETDCHTKTNYICESNFCF
ncbi:C-type lectin domain family 10 member A-like isoform X2 [Mytilus californianus]|uniref:C-type lectin domain family 10 member A-like isoform X2 n=1 Tax=Mytilus californianus TaxID=6549 RepID=UPI0022453AE9|nr:C-type lectin domain family 10 member A-like isoform X2 [Mytilus californianus]